MDGSNMKMMKNLKMKLVVLCVVVGVMGIIMAGVAEGEDCERDLRGLQIECLVFMHKGNAPIQDPNDRCCNEIKLANVPCVCSKLSRHLVIPPNETIEDLLDWPKVLHCFNFCGKPLAPGFKCGNFTVPPGPPPK
ncbi:uncharacterized protein LOC114753231 [Neltuma alba]|uniref:uncharacterized protein LOC114745881 n=1 Tax=Neltuma alba TaxID=207710 RepID=UPI0010A2FB60|nr:uncharacterized protein LOC114745881 [Prosopis alba]XP_028797727.1 uncharacterized protein LOC114753231 [Prosopis alba]